MPAIVNIITFKITSAIIMKAGLLQSPIKKMRDKENTDLAIEQ